MYKKLLIIYAMLFIATAAIAQGPGGGGSTDTIPDGAAYILNNGSSATLTGETLSTTESDYNVVQVTNGNLTLNNCTISKTGDSNSNDGDATSFYGINSAVDAKGSWTLTGNACVDNLVNNGAIHTAGFTLTYGSLSGSGTIDNGTGIGENTTEEPANDGKIYTLDGRCLGTTLPNNFRGVYIQNGKKQLKIE